MADAVRGLLAPWVGGAVQPLSPPSGVPSGVRSLLAFWVGGATAPGVFVPPIPPTPQSPTPQNMGGGTGLVDPRYSSLTRTWHMPGMRDIIERDDQEILEVIMIAVTKGLLH